MKKFSRVKILVIDDEPDMTLAIRITINVQEPDWEVIESHSGDKGLALIDSEHPDIVLLDLRMPGMTGFEVLQNLRRFSTVPVIILTVENDELNEVKALEAGADDFITKPFGHLELLAHIRSVLRRANGYTLQQRKSLRIGDLTINFTNHTVSKKEEIIPLTSTEFALLELLAENAGQVIPFEVLLGKIWGHNALDNKDYLKVYIRKLRIKIETDPSHPLYLLTLNGLGYKLVGAETQ